MYTSVSYFFLLLLLLLLFVCLFVCFEQHGYEATQNTKICPSYYIMCIMYGAKKWVALHAYHCKNIWVTSTIFGHLSFMPTSCVCDTLQTSREATNLIGLPASTQISFPSPVASTPNLSYPATVTSTPTASLPTQQHPTDNQTSVPASTTIIILSTVIPSTLVLLMLVCTVVVIILIVRRRITRKQVDTAHGHIGN